MDWMDQIFHGIESADAFIFLVSPDSVASEVCNVAVGQAAKNNKRIPQADIVTNLSFSGETDTLLTTSSSVLQVWDIASLQKIDSAQIVETACSRLIRNFDAAQWFAFFGNENYPPLCEGLP